MFNNNNAQHHNTTCNCQINKVAMMEERSRNKVANWPQSFKQKRQMSLLLWTLTVWKKKRNQKQTTHHSVHVGPLTSLVVAMWGQGRCYSAVNAVWCPVAITQPGPACACVCLSVCVSHLGLTFPCGNWSGYRFLGEKLILLNSASGTWYKGNRVTFATVAHL